MEGGEVSSNKGYAELAKYVSHYDSQNFCYTKITVHEKPSKAFPTKNIIDGLFWGSGLQVSLFVIR